MIHSGSETAFPQRPLFQGHIHSSSSLPPRSKMLSTLAFLQHSSFARKFFFQFCSEENLLQYFSFKFLFKQETSFHLEYFLATFYFISRRNYPVFEISLDQFLFRTGCSRELKFFAHYSHAPSHYLASQYRQEYQLKMQARSNDQVEE